MKKVFRLVILLIMLILLLETFVFAAAESSSNDNKWVSIACSADGSNLVVCADGDAPSRYATARLNLVSRGDIFTSTDSGATWTDQKAAGYEHWQSVACSADGKFMAAGVNNGTFNNSHGHIHTSSDGGETWTDQKVTGKLGPGFWQSITSSSDGSHLAVCVYVGNIFTSADGGITWTERKAAGTKFWQSIAGSADGSCLAACGSVGLLKKSGVISTSTDGGVKWTVQTPSGDIPTSYWSAITSSADGSLLAACQNGFNPTIASSSKGRVEAFATGDIFTSSDGGDTWTDQTASGSNLWSAIASSADGSHLAACCGSYGIPGAILTSPDGGITWVEQEAAGEHEWTSIACSADGAFIAACSFDGYIVTSSDGGVTWTVQVGQ